MIDIVFLLFKQGCGFVVNCDRYNLVTHAVELATGLAGVGLAYEIIQHIERRCHFTENRVAVVKERGRHGGNEKLRAVGSGSGVSHRKNSGLVVAEFRMKFIGEFVSGTTPTGFRWIAALKHESVDDAMESDIIIIAPTGEVEKIGASQRDFRGKQGSADVSGRGVNGDIDVGHGGYP